MPPTPRAPPGTPEPQARQSSRAVQIPPPAFAHGVPHFGVTVLGVKPGDLWKEPLTPSQVDIWKRTAQAIFNEHREAEAEAEAKAPANKKKKGARGTTVGPRAHVRG